MSIIMNTQSKVFKSFGSQSFITITLGILGILYFSIMSRLLNKEDFGYFAIITAVTTVLTSLTEAGLGASVIQKKNASNSFVTTAMSISMILGVAFTLFLFLTSGIFSKLMVHNYTLKGGYQIMSLTFLFHSINSIGRAIIIKKLNFFQYGCIDIISYTLSAIIGIWMAYQGFGFYSTIFAMVLHQGFISLILIITRNYKFVFLIDKSCAKQIVSYGGWLTGAVIVRNITQQMDRLIVTNWLPVSILGSYNRPSGFISQITGQINSIFDTILFPILSGINDDDKRIAISYEKAITLVIFYSIVLTSVFILGTEILISIFLGKKWLDLTCVFQIVSISIIFLCYGRIADCFFRSLGVLKSYFYTRVIVLVITCLFIFIGCRFGILGLAIGVTLSRAMDTTSKSLFLKPFINIDRKQLYSSIIKTIYIPVILFCIIYLSKGDGIHGSIIATSIYVMLLAFLCVFFPKCLGSIYYESIYIPIKKILIKK